MEHDLTKLKEGIQALKMDVTGEQLKKFDKYISLLVEWNKKMNLTAIVESDEIIVEHFLDSISILEEMTIENYHTIIDIGTGAGFPGVPIKILRPNARMVLLDSLKKRTEFLKEVSKELDLLDIEIIHSRAEDLARDEAYREKFDFVVSRAVASLNVLAEYSLP
ncbi:MAG: 16S rRNA (guanine(527)-N(7))-methyltransferase RsmG, partial [Caldicoprobacterales bacterium]